MSRSELAARQPGAVDRVVVARQGELDGVAREHAAGEMRAQELGRELGQIVIEYKGGVVPPPDERRVYS